MLGLPLFQRIFAGKIDFGNFRFPSCFEHLFHKSSEAQFIRAKDLNSNKKGTTLRCVGSRQVSPLHFRSAALSLHWLVLHGSGWQKECLTEEPTAAGGRPRSLPTRSPTSRTSLHIPSSMRFLVLLCFWKLCESQESDMD